MIIAKDAQENTSKRAREKLAADTTRVGRWIDDIGLNDIITSASQRGYGSIKLRLKDCPNDVIFVDTMKRLGYHIVSPKVYTNNIITISWTAHCETNYPEEDKVYNDEGTDKIY